jgi:chemotaxis protein histidine kinase CheA
MRQKSFFLCAFVLAWAPLAAPAQIEIIEYTGDGEFTTIEGGMVMPAPGEGDGESAPAGPPTPRLQELQKLEYDRRPSSMLAAWATPPKKPEAEKPPEAKPGEGQPPEAKPPEAKPPEVTPPAEKPAGEESGAPAPPANETEEQKTARLAAEKAAAEAAAKAKEEAAKKAAEAKAIQAEMESLRRNVTLGDWAAVKAYYATLTEAEAKAGYTRMLQSLQQGPQQRPQVPQQGQMYIEKNQFAPADVIGLAQAFPKKLEQASITTLGQFLRQSFDGGHQLETFLADVEPRLAEENFGIDKRLMARLLVAANEPRAIGRLVPTREEAEAANDREGLNLIARHVLAEYAKDSKVRWLEEAWKATQAVLAVGEVSEEVKKEALTRAVDIAPKIQKELGQAWLDESFTARPERGMEIVAAIGSASSLAIAAEAMNEEKREKLLELQTTAAKALLAAAPELAKTWARELELLAGNWLREAQLSYQYDDSTSMSPRMQRDYYGNFFYYNYGGNYRGNVPNPIGTAKVLEMRPTDAWLGHLGSTLAPRFQILFSQLYLKVGEEAQAFPYIESVCAGLPRQGKELADEFLRVWTKNHDPNSERNRTNQYMFFYGFEERANGIPLTRSKQERNLQELSEWVARLRKLPVELDDSLIASAFTTAHSSAEVYPHRDDREDLRQGGHAQALDPGQHPADHARESGGGLARSGPAGEEQDWTAPEGHPGRGAARLRPRRGDGGCPARGPSRRAGSSWVVKAALARREQLPRRARQGLRVQRPARRGLRVVPQARPRFMRQSYLSWSARRRACRPSTCGSTPPSGPAISRPSTPRASSPRPRSRPCAKPSCPCPASASERHLGMFAAALFTRMSNTAPAIKFRYVREGLSIVGDHKLAREARQVFDYYKDLVTEIQLRATIDGSDRVGKEAPFGLLVDIRHTREIERESGGFSKYLQNQNSQNFGYNYGRPLEDYRDKFEESLRTTLAEHFEVLSVTFNDPEVRSKAEPEYGWRVTPYAYALLKPRSEAVDRVPPIRLDLDFLDTTGYACCPWSPPPW